MRELMNNEMDGISGGLVGAPTGTGVVLLEANNATPWSNATSSGGCDSTGQCAIVYGAVGDTASGSLGPTDYTNYGIQSFQRFDDGTSLSMYEPIFGASLTIESLGEDNFKQFDNEIWKSISQFIFLRSTWKNGGVSSLR